MFEKMTMFAAVVGLVFALGAVAQAETYVYEPFDYDDGENLNGKEAQGLNWTNTGGTVRAGGKTYTDGDGNELEVDGNYMEHLGGTNVTLNIDTALWPETHTTEVEVDPVNNPDVFETYLGGPGATIWASYIHKSSHSGAPVVEDISIGPRLIVGQYYWQDTLAVIYNQPPNDPTDALATDEHFVILRHETDVDGNTVVDMWVDPPLGNEAGLPDLNDSPEGDFQSTSIVIPGDIVADPPVLHLFNAWTFRAWGIEGLLVDYDEIRMGTSYDDIVPFIPPVLYWQGGTGLWSDPGNDNWTDAVGGTDLPPTAKTNMIIDAATNDSVVTVGADFMTGGAGPAASVAIGAINTASLTVNGGVTLEVTGGVEIGGSGTMLVNGALTAGAGVTVADGGMLGGSGTITGAVTVDNGGTVAPGASIGTLGVTGNVAVGGTYAVEVSGSGAPVAGTNNDSLAVTGDVTIGTMGLDLVWLVGAKIGADGDGKFGGEYTIVTGTTVSGSPANVTVNSFVAKFPDGHTVDMWDSYYHDVTGPSGPGDVLVSVGPADPFTDRVTVTLPQVLRGDSNLDGRVMMVDALPIILNWQKTVPVGTGWELGNFNFDDKIMMNDALEIVLSWGQKTDADPPGPNPAGAVEAAAVADRATAVYDAATGFVWLEVNSALAYLQIIDPNSSGELGPKDPDGTKPFVGFHPLMAAALLEDERPHHVGEMNFGGLPQTAGPHLYVEATPGIPQEDFDFVLYTAALDWTDATVDVVWTPEPATMTLLMMGGALVMARRRRRK